MSSNVQLWCFLISFLYGLFFGLMSKLHFWLIKDYTFCFRFLISVVFVIDCVLGYILVMYHLNLGIFHIYFDVFVFIGFVLAFPLHKYVNYYIKKYLLRGK